MKYNVITSSGFDRRFKELNKNNRTNILIWIQTHLTYEDNPFKVANILPIVRGVFVQFRIGNFRLIGRIENNEILLLDITEGLLRRL
jgi:mRNA-degrading endonuclease RelE of RelBE toxin-antitoxin system